MNLTYARREPAYLYCVFVPEFCHIFFPFENIYELITNILRISLIYLHTIHTFITCQ